MTTPSHDLTSNKSADYPGKTLGIVGFALAFVMSVAGLVVSIIALAQSLRAGQKNGFALAGIIVSITSIVIGIVIIFFLILTLAFSFGSIGSGPCSGLELGVHAQADGFVSCMPRLLS
jgi:hypothetical protein